MRNDGYIYIVRCCDTELYKIGAAKDVKQRIDGMKVGNPYELVLVHSIGSNDYIVMERTLHERFDKKRVRGEWFYLDGDDLAWICGIVRLDREEEVGRDIPKQGIGVVEAQVIDGATSGMGASVAVEEVTEEDWIQPKNEYETSYGACPTCRLGELVYDRGSGRCTYELCVVNTGFDYEIEHRMATIQVE